MDKYRVELQEFYEGEYLDRIIFECMADDEEHAEEQACDAYPDCMILDVTKELHLDVIAELKRDIEAGDTTAIVGLLELIPEEVLKGYLPEED